MVLRLDAVETGRTYGAVASIAEGIILDNRAVLDRIGAPARTVLSLLSPLALPANNPQGPLGRHQVVGAMRRLLLAAASGRDLLLQVDDAHLLDDADVEVLVQLAMVGAPVFLLIAMRPMAPEAALARGVSRLQRAGCLKQLALAPLDDDETRRLVARASSTTPPDAVLDRIVSAAEGNPFAAIELAGCAPTGAGELHRLPGSVAEAITARLCDVPDDAMALRISVSACTLRSLL